MIAVSLNVGSGVHLIKPSKLYMCTHKHYKHNEDRCMALGVHGHGSAEPLSDVITRVGLQVDQLPLHLND